MNSTNTSNPTMCTNIIIIRHICVSVHHPNFLALPFCAKDNLLVPFSLKNLFYIIIIPFLSCHSVSIGSHQDTRKTFYFFCLPINFTFTYNSSLIYYATFYVLSVNFSLCFSFLRTHRLYFFFSLFLWYLPCQQYLRSTVSTINPK